MYTRVDFWLFTLVFFAMGSSTAIHAQSRPILSIESARLEREAAIASEKRGDFQSALDRWQNIERFYRENGRANERDIAVLAIAENSIRLGKPRAAIASLETRLNSLPPVALGILGNAYLAYGDPENAASLYERYLALPGLSDERTLIALNNLREAYTRQARQRERDAVLLEQEGESADARANRDLGAIARSKAFQVARRAFQLSDRVSSGESLKALIAWYRANPDDNSLLKAIETKLEALPASHSTIALLLEAGRVVPEPEKVLLLALAVARSIGDNTGISYSAGTLADLHRRSGSFEKALQYSNVAIAAATERMAREQLYRWQWGEGRIYRDLGRTAQARDAYRRSVATLSFIRREIASTSRDVLFDFREEIEPLHREYLDLLLAEPNGANLERALEVFDSLQLSKLENLFGDSCFETDNEANNPDTLQKKERIALIVPIVLEERFHVIVRLPDGQLAHSSNPIPRSEISRRARRFRESLLSITDNRYLLDSAYFYDLIFRPHAERIAASAPISLLFIKDGLLNTLPMSALHDNRERRYLIEKYPVSVALGRQFLRGGSSPPLDVAAFGLAIARPPSNVPLPGVRDELRTVREILGGDSYLDERFTLENLQRLSRKRSILHLATHGKFTGSTRTSYLQLYDRTISIDEIERLLIDDSPVLQLLILSACDTNAGNERAILGMGGMAIRSGVRSVIGYLWPVPDESALIENFYTGLKAGKSPSEALRFAQIQEIGNFGHPRIWSAFIFLVL
jgi:CHAT domain-containing protein